MTAGNILIREVMRDDIETLRRLSIETFVDTYASFNTPEDMQEHISKKFAAEVLLAELANSNNHFAILFFAGEPAGYIKLRNEETPEQLEGRKHIEVERIYVTGKFHGKGLGKALMEYCISYAAQKEFEVIWLGVWKENQKAFQFYTRCGFTVFGEQIFILGSDKQWDWLMKKELQNISPAP